MVNAKAKRYAHVIIPVCTLLLASTVKIVRYRLALFRSWVNKNLEIKNGEQMYSCNGRRIDCDAENT